MNLTSPFAAFEPRLQDPALLLPALLDAHVPGLGAHSLRTARLSLALARFLPLSPQEREALRLAALYHDAGKLYLPAQLLLAPRPLSPEETLALRRHPHLSLRLLAHASLSITTHDAIAHHHERWNGGGYPLGLLGIRIPLAARLLAIADVYDTLTHPRAYGAVLTRSDALQALTQAAGTDFDPELVELVAHLDEEDLP